MDTEFLIFRCSYATVNINTMKCHVPIYTLGFIFADDCSVGELAGSDSFLL